MKVLVYLSTLLICFALSGHAWAGEESSDANGAKKIDVVAPQIRLKDLAEIQGVRGNQLVGNGLVIGLDRTGDKTSKLANQELANFAKRFGIKVTADDVKSKNIAAVIITAQLPAFIKKGARLDVQVSSIGDAKSLQGGVLIQAPLVGADGRVYATAQGALSVGGFSAGSSGGGGASVKKNHTLVGRIPNGALVEREVPASIVKNGRIQLRLREPDFTTAQRVVTAVNERWAKSARAVDWGSIQVMLPGDTKDQGDVIAFMAKLEAIEITPDSVSRVVINERTGTIVAGAHVRLSPTAVAHGNLFITVKNDQRFSQPNGLSRGRTSELNNQTTQTEEENRDERLIVLQHAPTLGDLARALNALKVTPRDIISIFQALKNAGALHADLVIM